MSDTGKSQGNSDFWLIVLYSVLLLTGLALLGFGLKLATAQEPQYTLLGLGVLAVILPAALYPIASRAGRGGGGAGGDVSRRVIELLEEIEDHQLVSESTKRLIHRQKDRQMLADVITQDIEKGDYDAALALVQEMGDNLGYRAEAEKFRQQIEELRAQQQMAIVNQAIADVDGLCEQHEWDTARREVNRLQRLYSHEPRIASLGGRVQKAFDRYKHDLERAFLETAARDEVDKAMELLTELDKYLTVDEAEQYRETARGVIGKKKANLGVRFRLAVQDLDWIQALNTGEQIIREFPNSKFAEEVRGMLDLLRERSAAQRDAVQASGGGA